MFEHAVRNTTRVLSSPDVLSYHMIQVGSLPTRMAMNLKLRIASAAVTSPSIKPVSPGESMTAHLQMSLYLPYLHWDTYKLVIKRRHLVKKRLVHGRSRPVPEEIAKLDLEHRVAWAYLGHDPPFNCRRTLDQFGYPNLHDTRARDDDQMLYKMTKERKKPDRKVLSTPKFQIGHDKPMVDNSKRTGGEDSDGSSEADESSDEDVLDGTVLMVDQLWLWAVTHGK